MTWDVIIVGAGPVGHFAGIQFQSANVDSSRWTYRLAVPADTQFPGEMEHLERVLAAHAIAAARWFRAREPRGSNR